MVGLTRLRLAAEAMALLLGTAGAGLVAYLDLPDPERVPAPLFESAAHHDIIEVELLTLPTSAEPCIRGYSSESSRGDLATVLEVACGERRRCNVLAPETAICVAEEHHLGEGGATEIAWLAESQTWEVTGAGARVLVDAHTGRAFMIH